VAGQQDRPGAVETESDNLGQRMERLPPGHPSSPYEEDGTRKPPVARPTDRELPLPDERNPDADPVGPGSSSGEVPDRRFSVTRDLTAQEPASPNADEQEAAGQQSLEAKINPDDVPEDNARNAEARVGETHNPEAPQSDSRSWWEALPYFKEEWKHHEERWPQEQRPQVDRSQDEPGSWRGGGDQYLNAEENLVTGHALERIRPIEEKVNATLHEIKEEVPGCDLVGLKFSLKGEERFKEKVSDEVRAKPDRSIAAISDNMPDAVRYTFQFDREDYVDGYWSTLGCMEQHGYEMDFSRNSWGSSQYNGINTRWWTPSGQLFEVQFHTPESFEAKQLTHEAYERIRSPGASDEERGELYEFQSGVSGSVPIPADSLTIPDHPKKEA
jgi:hypothetical protein